MSTYEKHGHRWAIIAKSGEILGFAADEATARRWAAAPDLLAACKTIATEPDYTNPEEMIRRLRAAIAKAEGQS